MCAYKILPILRILSFLPVLLPPTSLIIPHLLFLPSFLPSFLPFFLPSFPHSFAETSVDAAGGEPGWTTAQRPGPQEAVPEAGSGSPAPRPARPSLQGATERCGGWGNRLLAVTDDAEELL